MNRKKLIAIVNIIDMAQENKIDITFNFGKKDEQTEIKEAMIVKKWDSKSYNFVDKNIDYNPPENEGIYMSSTQILIYFNMLQHPVATFEQYLLSKVNKKRTSMLLNQFYIKIR